MRKGLIPAVLFGAAIATAPACATKGFVRTSVGEVDSKVDSLATSLEETQARTEARIGQVDSKAEAAASAAANARRTAEEANTAAKGADSKADAVGSRVAAVEAAARRLIYEVTINESQGNFQFGQADLPEEAKAAIDELVSKLTGGEQGVFLEIEGHTDSTGSAELNQKLGLERAEAVKMYLYEQHKVPLHKMNVISYGEDKPSAPNDTRDGRAQNRRVVIRVLA
ncbi:MAG: OmpA family protein [Acidimicrobiia bacterium]|nr:OmpA family protein [Acidimicrobiia bacterium]